MDNLLSRRIPALPRRCFQPLAAVLLANAAAVLMAVPAYAVDTANPTVTVTAPALNSNSSSLSAITGTAADDTGLKRIDVYVYRSYTGAKQYFNFSTRVWGTTVPASLAVTPDPNTTGNPTSLIWSVTGASWPTSAEMPAGEYNMEVRSVDTSNKTSAYSRPLFSVGTPDSTVPTASFTTQLADVTVTDDHFPTSWDGKANDGSGSGVGYVQFSISRKFSAATEYWSGNTTNRWVTTKTTKTLNPGAPDGNGDQTWNYDLNAGDWVAPTGGVDLPQGQYTATYNVFDRYGNSRTINRTVNVLPLDTLKPESVLTGLKTPSKSDPETSAPTSLTGYSYDPLDENGVASGIATVSVGIFRTWNGTTLYWDGATSNWATAVKTYAVTLGAPDGNGHCAWSFPPSGVTMPTLAQGAYTIRVNTNDRYGNPSTLQQSLYIGPADTVAPEVTNVTANTNANALNSVSVTATDAGSGIMRLEITISRVRAGVSEWWNGTAWSTTTTRFSPTLSATAANTSVTWSSATGLPAGASLPSGTTDLPAGTYNIGVTVADRYLNSNSTLTPFIVTNASGVADTTAPTATITAPTNGAIVQSLSSVTGTAADEGAPTAAQSGLSEVQAVLTRILPSGNLTWNGTAWVNGSAILTPRAASGSSTNWSRTGLPSGANLPSGQYSLTVTALDQALNASVPVTVNFTLDAKPVAQDQDVTATGRLNSEGDPATIVLTATDPNSDAIQSWQVTTQPQHGSLTGTAPNLTYVADQGYFGPDNFTYTASDGTLESDPATVSITISAPPPVDALIKNPSDTYYTGDNITSTDGTNETVSQTVLAGSKATYLMKVQNEINASSLVLKVAGAGDSNGWTVRYYDAHTNGLDITDQVTSEDGWRPILAGAEASFRVEVTPPSNLTEDASLELLVSAEQDGNPALSLDVVKAVTTGRPSKQPDISIQGLDTTFVYNMYGPPAEEEQPSLPLIGANVFSSQAEDQKCVLPSTGGTRTYVITIRNAGSLPATYRFSGALSQDGWTAKYTAGGTWTDLTAAVGAGTYEFSLNPGQERQVYANVATESDSAPDEAALALSVQDGATATGQWQPGTWIDTAQLAVQAQSLAGVEYSLDGGTTWLPFTGQLTVPRLTVVGFRGVPAFANVPWRDRPMVQPVWSHNGEEPCGDTVWLQYKNLGTQAVSAQCRTSVAGTVTVVAGAW